ncbi:MAG: acyltransferase [candidate division NC10 bacterium]|nr:acyltransferase [candidate division NC10 bacterium]
MAEMRRVVTVAGIQMPGGPEVERNVERSLALATIAADRGAKLLCFAECFAWPWFPAAADSSQTRLAQPIPGPAVEALQDFAKRREVVLVVPVFERAMDGLYYNAAAVIDADGTLLGRYRKTHIPELPNYQEKFYFTPGDLGFPVFPTRYARVGVQICWDNFFPEGSRILALKGAEIICAPTAASLPAGAAKWERAIAANAQANGCFILRVNRIGQEPRMGFYGRSFAVDPGGEFVAEPSGANEGVILADLDLDRIAEIRETWTFFRERRPGLYGELA